MKWERKSARSEDTTSLLKNGTVRNMSPFQPRRAISWTRMIITPRSNRRERSSEEQNEMWALPSFPLWMGWTSSAFLAHLQSFFRTRNFLKDGLRYKPIQLTTRTEPRRRCYSLCEILHNKKQTIVTVSFRPHKRTHDRNIWCIQG